MKNLLNTHSPIVHFLNNFWDNLQVKNASLFIAKWLHCCSKPLVKLSIKFATKFFKIDKCMHAVPTFQALQA